MKNSTGLLAVMEPLQARMLLSASLVDGVLTIQGTEADDQISVIGSGSTHEIEPVLVQESDQNWQEFENALVKEILILAGSGNDSIDIFTQTLFDVSPRCI